MCDLCQTNKKPTSIIEAIHVLKEHVGNLSSSSQAFSHSLLASSHSTRGLSDKQEYWIYKMAEQAVIPKPEPLKLQVEEVSNVLAMFDKAAKHLKFPNIIINDPEAGEIKLYRAGPLAKFPGSITVLGRKSKIWYGRIKLDGAYEASGKAPQTLVDTITAFAKDPITVAAKYGKVTGVCCFCNKKLADEKSTHVGYGPVCAKKWALPWGAKPKEKGPDYIVDWQGQVTPQLQLELT